MGEAYSDFAGVYDVFMDDTPYEQWRDFLVETIQKYASSRPVRESSVPEGWINLTGDSAVREEVEDAILASERNLVLDLGCGTGALTQLMYDAGYDMIGVDQSADMLNVALRRRDERDAEILYLQQDMRELELYSTVGTVYSVCDTLNYLLEEEELLGVFSLVHNYLYSGGIFIFDFNTEYKYREVIGNSTIVETREEGSFIWENDYDEETGINTYDVTFFVQEEGELFRRFQETHLQRGYTVETMTGLVEQAGLELLEVLDADTRQPATSVSERVYIVAREQGKGR